MFTIERKVGRLVETVMQARVTREEIEAADQGMFEAVRSIGEPCIVWADYRRARFLLEDDAARLTEIYRRFNSNIERSAILVSATSAVAVLQIERVIREAKHPSRRAFRDANEAAAWLDEALSPPERARLRVIV